MKKAIFLATLIAAGITVNAQKIYSTQSGQIKFNASTPLETVSAVNNQVDSKMLDKTGQIVFSVLVKGFKFENQLMEDHFNENYMESSKIPKAEFKGYITNISSVNFSKDGVYNIALSGTLSLHDVSQKVTVSGTLTINNGRPSITGTFKIKIKDYGISGLYIGEKIAAEPEITVTCKYD